LTIVGEAERLASSVPDKQMPLWQDLQGKTAYRVFGALILDELCLGTDMSTAALLRRLRYELGRSLSRQSLAAWRRGDQAIPNDVLIATTVVVRGSLPDAARTVVMRVLGDPNADPGLADGLRTYYAQGRAEAPAKRPSWVVGALGRAKRRKTIARVEQTPLWRNLRGKTTYRVFGALTFDELCQETDINTEELRRQLRETLHRPMSRQSIAAWRRGNQPVPTDVLMATGAIVNRTLAEASLVVVARMLSDPDTDSRFSEMLRLYLGHGEA
jgi:hypothetical protein